MASKDDYDLMVARRQQQLINSDTSQILSQLQSNWEASTGPDSDPYLTAGSRLAEHESHPITRPISQAEMQAIIEIAQQFEAERARQKAIQQIDLSNRPGLLDLLKEKLGMGGF